MKYIYVFQATVFVAVRKGRVFYFCFFPCQIKFFFIILNCSTVKIGTVFIKDRCTALQIASDLNITMFPSVVKSLILHTFKTCSISAI